jgi:DNA-binding transcriptional ArsR family regulator
MGRELSKENFKKIIRALRVHACSWTELKNDMNLSDKTLTRALEYLEYWGLIKKDEEGHWNWFENIRTYETEQDYTLAINHSKNLIESLDRDVIMASIIPETYDKWKETPMHPKQLEMSSLKDACEEHLKTGYPSLYAEIVEFRNLMREKERVTVELQKEAHFHVEINDLLGRIANYLNYEWSVEKKYRKKIEILVGKLPKERLETIKEINSKKSEQVVKLNKELKGLILKVENGEPLHGVCNLCPNIKVAA